MWIVGEGGDAVNIARADVLFIDKNDCYVSAVFSGVGAILDVFKELRRQREKRRKADGDV